MREPVRVGLPCVYFLGVSKDPQATAAKMNPAVLSASVRIVSRGILNSSCATLPVIIADIPAVAKAMMRKTARPMVSGE
jgi:hypothetical protein